MRRLRDIPIGPLLAVVLATPASALERKTLPATPVWWPPVGTVTVSYYNNCTGWVQGWYDWQDGEQVGVVVGPIGEWGYCPEYSNLGMLETSWLLAGSGVPSGYGYTGTIAVRSGPNCTGPILASQPFLPPVTTLWVSTDWDGLGTGGSYSLVVTWAAPTGFRNPAVLASDHPSAGPTGPPACGACYPTTRSTHTRYFGADGAYCPYGVPLSDGTCDVELLAVLQMSCTIPVAVELRSWGEIKALYR